MDKFNSCRPICSRKKTLTLAVNVLDGTLISSQNIRQAIQSDNIMVLQPYRYKPHLTTTIEYAKVYNIYTCGCLLICSSEDLEQKNSLFSQ